MDPTILKNCTLIKLNWNEEIFFSKNTLFEKDTNFDNSCDTVGRINVHTLYFCQRIIVCHNTVNIRFFYFSSSLFLVFLSRIKGVSNSRFLCCYLISFYISVSMHSIYSNSLVNIALLYSF